VKTFVDAYREPRLQFALAAELAESRLVAAAMDVSDGLALDLQRMCSASGCSARIVAAALDDPDLEALAGRLERDPMEWQVGGGDDYALLCSVESERSSALEAAAGRHRVPAARIGAFEAGERPPVIAVGGEEITLEGGWDPFRREGEA